jgi:hypothetical protein
MIIFLNSITQLIFVMVKCGVLSEVQTEFLNIIQTSFSFKGLYDYKSITTEQQLNKQPMPKHVHIFWFILQCFLSN